MCALQQGNAEGAAAQLQLLAGTEGYTPDLLQVSGFELGGCDLGWWL